MMLLDFAVNAQRSLKTLFAAAVIAAFLLPGQGEAGVLLNTNAVWSYLKGTEEASSPATAWRQPAFNATSWLSGPAPIFYGDPLIGTELSDMRNTYSTVYLRRTFNVSNPSTIAQLNLQVFVDDGCVIWINGVEVARVNAPGGDLSHDSVNGATADEANLPYLVNLTTPAPSSYLVAGANIIAVHALNSSLGGSSDFQFDLAIAETQVDNTPPAVLSRVPAGNTVGALNQITVQFTEPVTGVNAEDLLIQGKPAANVTGGNDTYTFNFSEPLPGTVNISWASGHGITDLAFPPNPFNATASGSTWSYTLTDINPPQTAAILPPPSSLVQSLVSIEVQFNESVTGVDAADLLINGVPATNVTAFNAAEYVFRFPAPNTGTVQIAWSNAQGIRDISPAANAFAGGSWTYLFDPKASPPEVIINEFLAVNEKGLRDEEGDVSDWIELFNASTQPVNLLGWSLTDDATDPAKWRFPNVVLNPGSYLVVFADEKNRTIPTSPLHTNFKLEKNGEYLALIRPDRLSVATEFRPAYPAQRADISYGLDRFTRVIPGYFATPTPSAVNSDRGTGFAPDVEFSTPGGTFTNGFLLALSVSSPTAAIHYTLDGTVPTTNSTRYTDPISISTKRRVRARSFQTGLIPGPVRSEYYLPMAPSLRSVSSDLPILVIDSFGTAIPNDGDAPAFMAVYEPGANGRTSLTNRPTLTTRVAMDKRGSSTLGNPKANYNLEAWDEANADKEIDLLDLPTESDFILHAPFSFDPSLFRNPLAYEISRQMGRYAPRYRFVEVYVNSGTGTLDSTHYVGVYNLLEKVKRDDNRVNIARLDPQDITTPSVTGGYIFKIDRADPGDSGFVAGGQGCVYSEPKEAELRTPQRQAQRTYLSTYLNNFRTALDSPSFTNTTSGYAAWIDTPAWIDHHIINVLAFNVDALRLSAFLHKDRNGKLAAGPVWDFDRALGSTDGRDSNPRIFSSSGGTDFFRYGTQQWWGRLFEDIDFWQKWVDRWQDLRLTTLANSNFTAIISNLNSKVLEAAPRDLARWGQGKREGSQTGEANFTRRWLTNRAHFIDTNFLAKPVFSLAGGEYASGAQLSLQGPSASTLYYTIDGSDPRLPGGGVSPAAKIYTGPITLSGIATVTARSFKASHRNLTDVINGGGNPALSTPWSGVTQARFTPHSFPRPGDLAVTEIHDHPQAPSPAERIINPLWTAASFEFIELQNISSKTLDLFGSRFTQGIEMRFNTNHSLIVAPGQTVILAAHLEAFKQRYGTKAGLSGPFDGDLSDSGESLRMENPLNQEIFEFSYNNAWWPVTDGLGYSLVLQSTTLPVTAWSRSTSWRASSSVHGSPGETDPAPPTFPTVVINEALTHTDLPQIDAVEIKNLSAQPADISHWCLTDDRRNPFKYRFPAGTILNPGGFLLIDESQFNRPDATTNAFRISSLGESLWIFAAQSNSVILPYAHGFKFDAAFNGVTFGRHITSDNREHFVSQISPSLGSENLGPTVGPVVISEIMYHPPDILVGTNRTDDTQLEFIELQNITSTNVPLYDPLFPTNVWRIRDAVQFSFPTNTTLTANSFVLLVSFNPATNATAVGAFRTRYGITGNVPLFGPWDGKLDNSSDSIELVRPDGPVPAPADNAGEVPWVLADRVEYSQFTPWPTNADGGGASLQRKSAFAFGNDPVQWYTTTHTAGRANDFGPLDSDRDGMTDEFEDANGFNKLSPADADLDADNDGLTNLEEFRAGTNPRNASSVLQFQAARITGPNTFVLEFQAVAGRSYSVWKRTSLTSGAWTKLGNTIQATRSELLNTTDSIPGTAAGAAFYQLRLE